MKLLNMFEKFLGDDDAWEMFVTGRPGTGKTTDLGSVVKYCIDNGITYQVCAYTHKACGILRNKLPLGANVGTLHSFLRKRPTINDIAIKAEQIEKSRRMGESDLVHVLIVDEFSMVGEADLMDIRSLQDQDYDGNPGMKVLWVGDLNQLPPVKDLEAVVPHEPYWCRLTKIYRTAEDNKLQDTVHELADIIEGLKEPAPLKRHETFIEQTELLDGYIDDDNDKVILVYTNERVQDLNELVMGRNYPVEGDSLFCGNAHRYFKFKHKLEPYQVAVIDSLWGESIGFNTKYKTLEFLLEANMCEFFVIEDSDGIYLLPAIFGTYNYKVAKDELGKAAAAINAEIQAKFKANPSAWAKANAMHPLARRRALAWRRYLTFKDYIVCLDFDKAMTIHKSQGSTFKHVYLDAKDLELCKVKNFLLYVRLYYVGVSRASYKVITN